MLRWVRFKRYRRDKVVTGGGEEGLDSEDAGIHNGAIGTFTLFTLVWLYVVKHPTCPLSCYRCNLFWERFLGLSAQSKSCQVGLCRAVPVRNISRGSDSAVSLSQHLILHNFKSYINASLCLSSSIMCSRHLHDYFWWLLQEVNTFSVLFWSLWSACL